MELETYTFHDPQGQEHSIQGPAGASREEAFHMLQLRDGAKQEGASSASPTAIPSHQSAAQPAHQGSEHLPAPNDPTAEIMKSSAVNAVIGAASPEILTGAGKALEWASPAAGRFAPAVRVAGQALEAGGVLAARHRVRLAVSGGLSGAVSESAGQVADAHGATPMQGLGVRLVASLVTPSLGSATHSLISSRRTEWAVTAKVLFGSEPIAKQVATARQNLASSVVQSQPQNLFHQQLQESVEATRQTAAAMQQKTIETAIKEAEKIKETNPAAAQKVIDEAIAQGKRYVAEAETASAALKKAAGGKLETAHRVMAQSDKHLQALVGVPEDFDKLGGKLRDITLKRTESLEASRIAAYKANEAVRDTSVKTMEFAGQYMDTVEGMPEFLKQLDKTFRITKEGLKAAGSVAEVTDEGVRAAGLKLYKALKPANKAKPTFGAVDEVRRYLGKVAYGGEAEGYDALKQRYAKGFYETLSKMQEKYAGSAQATLQADYTAALKLEQSTKGKTGRTLMATDRLNPEEWVKDAASIPKTYFKTAQGVRDLIQATESKEEVFKSARSYAARILYGHDAKAIQGKLKSSDYDWMKEVPALYESTSAYANKLAQIERLGGQLEAKAGDLTSKAVQTTKQAAALDTTMKELGLKEASARVASRVEEGTERVAQATTQAKEKYTEMTATVDKLASNDYPVRAVTKLLTSGSREEQETAVRLVRGKPGGKAAIEGSVRAVLRDMSEGNVRYNYEMLQPLLRNVAKLEPTAMKKLDKDVTRLLDSFAPAKALPLIQKMLLSVLNTGVVVGTPRAATVKQALNED